MPDQGNSGQIQICDFYVTNYRRARKQRSGSYRKRLRLRLTSVPPDSPTGVVPFGEGASISLKGSGLTGRRQAPSGEIRFSSFQRRRGARLTGSFKATLASAGGPVVVTGSFDTFVRDLVDPARLKSRLSRRLRTRPGTPGGSLLSRLRGGRKSLPAESPPASKRFPALYSAARIKEVRTDGKPGLALSSILANSLWQRLGLRDGDVLLRLGSAPMASTRDLRQVRRLLARASSLSLQILRDGRPRTLRLTATQLTRLRQEFAL